MRRVAPIVLALAVALVAPRDGVAEHQLLDYRYFRALSIDLVGRPPSDDELAAFEQPGFDLDRWIDAHLSGPSYAERLRRIYMDALRLEAGAAYKFEPSQSTIVRQTVTGPDGREIYIYFRHGQRRLDPVTDGEFCLSQADTGYADPSRTVHGGVAKHVSQAVLDAKTVVVKPWWLYADYRAKKPVDLYSPDWQKRFPGYELTKALLVEPDGHTPTTEIRVCKEEAQTADTGAVYATGRGDAKVRPPPPVGRKTRPPVDTPLARKEAGKQVSCATGTGFRNSAQCGCGVGLERCLPGAAAFVMPIEAPIGPDEPFVAGSQSVSEWEKMWWAQEAERFLDRLFAEDRDFREVLTGRWTEVNGPLAHFYRFLASATCCGPAADAGYLVPDPLVQPSAMPADLPPVATDTWVPVADRGPHAAGIMTMPVFLTKYGSRRARAHVLYNAFLCRDFIASKVQLAPSTEPDLMKRPGCSTCHTSLEPMAAYFSRVTELDWTWLPAATFPLSTCNGGPRTELCNRVYDPAFHMLRSSYAAPAHAEAGPIGLAQDITTSPEFAPCVVKTVAQSLLGRPLAPEEDAWRDQLVDAFVQGGYRMRTLVRAIVKSGQYRATYVPAKGTP